jgi:hypothetical protein
MLPNEENAWPMGPWRSLDLVPKTDVAAMDWLLTDPRTGPNARCPYCFEDFADPENTYHDGVPITDSKSDDGDEYNMPHDNCTYCGKHVEAHPERNMFSFEQTALDLRKRTMPPTQPSDQYYDVKLGEEITPAMARSFDYQPHPTAAVPEPDVRMPKTGVFAGLADANDDKKDALRQPSGAPQDPGAGSAKRKMGSGLGSQRGGNDDLTMLVVNARGDLEQVTIGQLVTAILSNEVRMFQDYQPDEAGRFRALCSELSSFVGSDRDIKESKHFRQHRQDHIRTMREVWPEMVYLQDTIPLIDVRDFPANRFEEGSPFDRFYDAIGVIVQDVDHIMSQPVRPMANMGGGRGAKTNKAKTGSSQIRKGRRRRAT